MKGFKGFDKSLRCRGMQFQVGETHEVPTADLCRQGLHWCENPLDCLSYYKPGESRYASTEADGAVSPPEAGGDSKRCSTRLKIAAEISIGDLIRAGVEYIKNSCAATTGYAANAATTGSRANAATTGSRANAATTGDAANAATTGYAANAATTGDAANAATTGDAANAEVSGKHSIAAALGISGKARGAVGCWIVLAERNDSCTDQRGSIKTVKTALVDGENIKADTFYTLKNGEFVEVK